MDIFDNPFYILQASCRDNKRTIMSLAEEKSLLLDPELVAKAKDDLINPRKRLPVEMAWLPGLSSKVSNTLLSCLKSSQFENNIQDYNICDLAELNLLVSSLLYDVTMNDGAYNCLDGKILRIAELYEYLDSDEIMDLINSDRIAAGFPEVNDIELIEDEIHNIRFFIKQSISKVLEQVPSDILIKTVLSIVKQSIDDEMPQGLVVIDDIVDSYEIGVEGFVEQEKNNILRLIESINDTYEHDLSLVEKNLLITKLISVMGNWQRVVAPIQISKTNRGLQYAESYDVSTELRNFAINLCNLYDEDELSARLLKAIRNSFIDLEDLVLRIDGDLKQLDELILAKKINDRIEDIDKLLKKNDSDSQLSKRIEDLKILLERWRVSALSQVGEDEEDQIDCDVLWSSRSLAIDLFNNYGNVKASIYLMKFLQEKFSRFREVHDKVSNDLNELNKIVNNREQEKKQREEALAAEITYETKVGLISGKHLKISPDGIEWEGRTYPLKSIQHISWGTIKKSVNNIPTGTDRIVRFYSYSQTVRMNLGSKQFDAFVECLWRGVGVRLFLELLENLKNGKTVSVGTAIMKDTGMELQKYNFFSENERKFFAWNEIRSYTDNGMFVIASRRFRGFDVKLSYIDNWDVFIYEMAIKDLQKHSYPRMSDMLRR